jgi:hypothetical protein
MTEIVWCSAAEHRPSECCRMLGRRIHNWDRRCGQPTDHLIDILQPDGTRRRHTRCVECVEAEGLPFSTIVTGAA